MYSSFKDWLFVQLQGDDILDMRDYDNPEEITLTTLYEDTELTEDAYETYKAQYISYCKRYGLMCVWDFSEV